MKPKIIIDSGAYTAYKKGITIDIDRYGEFVLQNRNKFENFFNLDVVGDGKKSYQAWKYLKSIGVETIPVYHIGTDERLLVKYLDQADYIGLGAIANLVTGQRIISLDRIWKKYLLDEKGHARCRIHGLGMTAISLVNSFPWYSVDSFTPIFTASYGGVYLPIIVEGRFDFIKGFTCAISSQYKHQKGSGNTFINLPPLLKQRYLQLFEENGYDVGQIFYEKKKPRRRKEKGKLKIEPFFELEKYDSEGAMTLANNWKVRIQWNLFAWHKVIEQLNPYQGVHKDIDKPIIYVGNSGIRYTRILTTIMPIHDMLISYLYITPQWMEVLQPYLKTN